MGLIIGIVLAIVGVITIFIGDKDLGLKGELVLKLFSWPRGGMKWIKVLLGVALIYAGITIVLHAMSNA